MWLADDDWGVSDSQARTWWVTRHPEACRCRKSSKVLLCAGSQHTFFVFGFADGHPSPDRSLSVPAVYSPRGTLALLQRSSRHLPSKYPAAAVVRCFGAKKEPTVDLPCLTKALGEQEFPSLVNRTIWNRRSASHRLPPFLSVMLGHIQPNFPYLRPILSRTCWINLAFFARRMEPPSCPPPPRDSKS